MVKRHDEALTVEYDRPGGAEVLELRPRPLTPPGRGEVTVEVITTGISHIDGFIRSGREETWSDDPWPRRSGSDFAGIVVASGDGAARFRRGAEVIGHVRAGAHAEYVTVSEGALVARPRGVTWETAGGLYLAGATALDTVDELRVGPDDVVVISAAAGGVGSIEAQIARHRGATVIGTCGDRNFDYLRQLGIKPVRYGEGIADRIRAAAGRPVTAMVDNFGQDGRDLADELGVPPARYRSSEDRRQTELGLLDDDPAAVARGTRLLEEVVRLAERRAFTVLVSGFYPLAAVAEAYEDLARLHARGKVILGTRPVTTVRSLKARDVFEAAR
ncbi:NADP-dependent oxidoreductase [Microbacterium sp. T2.11-28]|uniref:NADP-dependent oxidoreductase n=1 Tax=unclassified Microbacterium TaxID=2609290 RepID=UPI0024779FCC|nr:NADP-dependent oxidoreductase [Microbacterium sp. T2.11-28]CAI9394295.1 Quinone oxidoreductase 1 [Microbacterium sp. T2.11-28]